MDDPTLMNIGYTNWTQWVIEKIKIKTDTKLGEGRNVGMDEFGEVE